MSEDRLKQELRSMVFSCPTCGAPGAVTVEAEVDIHSGATYHCAECQAEVIFEAFTVEKYQTTARLHAALSEMQRERDGWEKTAVEMSNDAVFWRDLIRETGRLLGPAFYVSDDGSIQDEPLALKVPELVRALTAQVEAQRRDQVAEGWTVVTLQREEIAQLTTKAAELADKHLRLLNSEALLTHRAEAAEAQVETQQRAWQPMETAPKDGTRILVNFGPIGVHAVSWTEANGITCWAVDDCKHGPYPLRSYQREDMLGWMPLPASPSSDTETK